MYFKIISVIVGTVIGAGFITGKEIYIFFNQYCYGLFGLIFANLIIYYIIFKVLILEKMQTNKPKIRELNKNILSFIIDYVIKIFLLISFCIMIAAIGAYLEQELGIEKIIGSFIGGIICFFIFCFNINGIIRINVILVPIIIIVICIMFIINAETVNFGANVTQNDLAKAILQGVLYSSYNAIILIPILKTLKKYIKTKKQALKIATIVFAILITTSGIIFFLLNSNIAQNIEIPLARMSEKNGNVFKVLVGLITLFSIITTATSAGYGLLKDISKNKYFYANIVLCLTGVLLSGFGFTNLLTVGYTAFGYIGIIYILKSLKQ